MITKTKEVKLLLVLYRMNMTQDIIQKNISHIVPSHLGKNHQHGE